MSVGVGLPATNTAQFLSLNPLHIELGLFVGVIQS